MEAATPVSVFANAPGVLGHAPAAQLPDSLEQEIRAIYRRSPLYGQRFPLHNAALQWSCYREIPILTKKEILDRGHTAFFADYAEIERGLQEKKYEYEHTSGTTSGPMTVVMEDGWWNAQLRRAYLAHPQLAQYVDRPYRKAVLAPIGCSSNLCPYEDHPFPHRYFDGTVYLNLSSDPFAFPEAEWDRIVLELQALKPEVLEGEPVYLALLARAAKRRHVSVPSLRTVILTYGKASLQHSRRIAEVFPAAQVDLYGSTEAGYIFVGDAFKDNLHVIDGNAFVELVPWRPDDPRSRRDAPAALFHRRHCATHADRLPDPRARARPVFQSGGPGGLRLRDRRGVAGELCLLALEPRPGFRQSLGFPVCSGRDRTEADGRSHRRGIGRRRPREPFPA